MHKEQNTTSITEDDQRSKTGSFNWLTAADVKTWLDERDACALVASIRKNGEATHGNRELHVLRREEGKLVFPVDTRRGHTRVGQPEKRDVIEHVVSCKTFLHSVEGTRDQLQTAAVVIDHERGQTDGRIRQPPRAFAAASP